MRILRVFGISDIPITTIKLIRDSAMLKLMGELLKRNVAVESVEVLRKKIKSIKKREPARTCEDLKIQKNWSGS
jgi:hypothetical protein